MTDPTPGRLVSRRFHIHPASAPICDIPTATELAREGQMYGTGLLPEPCYD